MHCIQCVHVFYSGTSSAHSLCTCKPHVVLAVHCNYYMYMYMYIFWKFLSNIHVHVCIQFYCTQIIHVFCLGSSDEIVAVHSQAAFAHASLMLSWLCTANTTCTCTLYKCTIYMYMYIMMYIVYDQECMSAECVKEHATPTWLAGGHQDPNSKYDWFQPSASLGAHAPSLKPAACTIGQGKAKRSSELNNVLPCGK